MNKGTLRTIMYIALGVLIFSVVINLFFSILPYLLVGGAAIYVVTKVVGYFNSKRVREVVMNQQIIIMKYMLMIL